MSECKKCREHTERILLLLKKLEDRDRQIAELKNTPILEAKGWKIYMDRIESADGRIIFKPERNQDAKDNA